MNAEYTTHERLEKITDILAEGVLALMAYVPSFLFITADRVKSLFVFKPNDVIITQSPPTDKP